MKHKYTCLFLFSLLTTTTLFPSTKQQKLKQQLAIIRENPNNPDALYKTARLLKDLQKYEHVLYFVDRALNLYAGDKTKNDEIALFLLELGTHFFNAGNAVQAVSTFKKLVSLEQTYEYFHHNIGFTLARHLAKHYEAIEHYKKAMLLPVHTPETTFCCAMSNLSLGNFAQGWEQYKARWKRPKKTPRAFAYPLENMWSGEDLFEKVILIRCEQGLGDTLHFIRYAQLLKEQGATVIIEAQPPLFKLLSLCPYIDKLIAIGASLPIYDYQIPLLDLPAVFKTTLQSIPNKIPYLFCDNELEKPVVTPGQNQGFFGQSSPKMLKIGICWYGDAAHGQSKFMPLKKMLPLLQMDNVQFYSLQKFTGLDQLDNLPKNIHLHTFDELDTKNGPFMDTAAIIKQLDLVITADTSIAHLAGGLGVKTWIVLPFPAEWRWLMYRDDSPWYPTVKLFRQRKSGDWSHVQKKLLKDLEKLIPKKKETPNNLKTAFFYAQQGNYQKSFCLYKELLQNDPENTQLMFDTAYVLKKLHRYDEAIELYEKIFAHPNYTHNPKVKLSASHAYLISGNFEKGLPLFEYRWFHPPSYNQKLKNYLQNHERLDKKTVLLKTEFGLGDTMQFIRYAKLLKEKGATVIVEGQKPLVELLSLCPYIDTVVTKQNQNIHSDFTCQLMSLPFIFNTRLRPNLANASTDKQGFVGQALETISDDIPYLHADKNLEQKWSSHIDPESFNIGICWHADPHKNSDNTIVQKDGESKSIPLKLLAQLSDIKNVRLYSLQKVDGLDQLKKLPQSYLVHSFGKKFDEKHGAFMDTAAVIQHLDLVITIDTSVAHLAGALGKQVWVLLPHTADWRWLQNRNDSPWYPTMKLFRQPKPKDWKSVVDEIKEKLVSKKFFN